MPEIITIEEGKELLSSFKAELQLGIKHWEQGKLEAAIAIYKIRETGVWKFDFDDNGDSWDNRPWNDYIRWLSRSMDFKRTMLLEFASVLRILTGPTINFSLEDISNSGLDIQPLLPIKRYLDYHNRTGEVRGLSDPSIADRLPPGEDLGDQIRALVYETHALPNPEERMKRIKEIVNGDDYDEPLFFAEGPDEKGRVFLGWVYNGGRGLFAFDKVPSVVLDYISSHHVRFTMSAD